jgi:hypothetical protein
LAHRVGRWLGVRKDLDRHDRRGVFDQAPPAQPRAGQPAHRQVDVVDAQDRPAPARPHEIELGQPHEEQGRSSRPRDCRVG